MSIAGSLRFIAAAFIGAVLFPSFAFADVSLGEAARAPGNIFSQLGGPLPFDLNVNGGFTVNTDSREQVRSFYNAIYPTSENVPMNSTADVPNCVPGENSEQFVEAVLRRINWFRAMAGIPAAVTLYPTENAGSQQVAVMISANHTLNHDPPPDFTCYNDAVAHFAGGNQAEGVNGPDAVTDYIWDFGGNNSEVGHRRWILLPQTAVMGTGDVPTSGPDDTNAAANSIWVFDSSIYNPRPATRQPYVSWPPEGFVPYQVVFPYWSFALSNADVSLAQVTMLSNGVPVPVIIQPQTNGFGENTLVWVPMGLDASCECTAFPFNGTDTVYSVTVSNINNNNGDPSVTNLVSFSYNVTVFDPAVPGADFIPATISGPPRIAVNTLTTYSVAAINNPHVTSYQWITTQVVPGNISDDANDGLVNFTMTPTPDYSVIASAPDGSGSCFHLCDDNATSQILQLNELLYPSTNTTLSFKSLLGISTSDEGAHVEASTDGGTNWQDLFEETGCNSGGQCETTFTPHTLSLSNYAGFKTLLRFDYQFFGGSYYPGVGQSSPNFGWCIEDIVLANTAQLINQSTNLTTTTRLASGDLSDDAQDGLVNFSFSPPANDYFVATNGAPDGSGFCFHLCDDNATSQILQLNEILLPNTNTTVSFDSFLGYSTMGESAHVQMAANGTTNWQDLFEETGCYTNGGGPCDSAFSAHTVSLAPFAGQQTLLRFDYQYDGDSFPGIGQSGAIFGWCLENIVVTNAQQLVVSPVNTTNFVFAPTQPGTYFLQVAPVIFNQFPLSPGPIKQVVVSGAAGIVMDTPIINQTSVLLNFTVSGNLTGAFKLLQADQLGSAWTTNTAAVLSTNADGSSFLFTTTNGPAMRFYRVLLVP